MRAMVIQSDFTGGELDPKLYGRVSIPRYQSGLSTAKNVDIMVTGGATRRAGKRFIRNAGSGITVRQIPFVIFRTDTTPASLKGYVVEFRSDNKIRFYVDGALILSGGVPYEIATPFLAADLSLIKYEQFNNRLYLVHPNFPPCILSRTNDTSWSVTNISFTFDAPLSVTGSFWTERANPKNIQLNSVCWSGTQYVAVGMCDATDAYIVTSPDGIAWTEQSNPKAFFLYSVCWSGTQFVAVGYTDGVDAYIVTSPDGIAWTERANPKNCTLNSICWSGTQFVAVGNGDGVDAYILTSPDGVTWTEQANPKNVALMSICWASTFFVAVGYTDGVTDAYILTSPDGITWTEQANPKNFVLSSVCWSGTQFVAVGYTDGVDAYILTSPDGVTWTERANPKLLMLYSVIWDGNQFVAVGYPDGVDAYILTSPDGVTWTETPNPKNFRLFSVIWAGNQFVAVGDADGVDAYLITAPRVDDGYGIHLTGQIATAKTGEVAHNWKTGMLVTIAGAAQPEYNGTFQITVVDSKTFTYVIAGAPSSPATGTITASRVPWGSTGYPSTITFFEQRMILARTKTHPQTIWGSETNNLTNFVLGVYDSSPFEFVPSAAASSINQLISTTQVVALTNDKEITMSGGSGLPLTPSNVQIKAVGRYGSKDGIRPLPIGAELLFATRSGKRVRGMAYKLVEDSYNFPNVCIMSEHLLAAGIVEMWHATEPQSVVYILTSDGKIARVTYDREQEVVAFSRYETDGLYKGLCVVQEGLKDQVYVTVERVIGGVSNIYVELFDETLNTDCAITGTDVAGKTTWTGLGHLEGKSVDVVADGASVGPLTVASGQIVLAAAAKTVEIGLNYESELYDLKPEIPVGDGTAQGRTSASVSEIIVRLESSRGCVINGQTIPADAAPFRGEKKISELGWSGLAGSTTPAGKIPPGQVQVKQTLPLPFTVLAIIKRLTVND